MQAFVVGDCHVDLACCSGTSDEHIFFDGRELQQQTREPFVRDFHIAAKQIISNTPVHFSCPGTSVRLATGGYSCPQWREAGDYRAEIVVVMEDHCYTPFT